MADLQAITSEKKRVFAAEYVRTWSKRGAIVKAGYSPCRQNVRDAFNRMMRDPQVKEYIAEYLKDVEMSAREVVARLAAQARGDVGDFLDEAGMVVLTEEAPTALLKSVVQTVKEDGTLNIKIDMYDAQNALIQLAKIGGLFVEKIALTDPTGAHEYLGLGDEERAARIEALLNAARKRKEEDGNQSP